MSLSLKLVVLLASYAILWFQIHIDYRKPWSDKRTITYKWAFGFLKFVLLPCAVIASFVVIILDDQASKATKGQLRDINVTLKSVATVVGVQAPAEIAKAVSDLKSKVAGQQQELTVAQQTIKDLEVKAEKAARGITETFDYDGTKRISPRPGHVNLVSGPETVVFKRMVELQSTQQWHELLVVAERQARTTPDWLTPHLFCGVAFANMNNKNEAIRWFQLVVSKAHGDPAYAEAEQLLKRLQMQK